MTPRRTNTAWKQRNNILAAFIANWAGGGGSPSTSDTIITEEDDQLVDEDGNPIVPEA